MSDSSDEQNDSSNEKKDQSSKKEDDSAGISDEQLPEELQPSEDNPLAEPLTEEEAPDDMDDLDMMGGGTSGDPEDEDAGGEDSDASSGTSGDEPSSDGESTEDDGED